MEKKIKIINKGRQEISLARTTLPIFLSDDELNDVMGGLVDSCGTLTITMCGSNSDTQKKVSCSTYVIEKCCEPCNNLSCDKYKVN
ncbi:MAG: hypothetical protein LBV69_03150 [Bacteroidales bacterium]|jgi:hypothetical protein|nr:hypothetical protein [Bacteroidales bacterium]